MKIFVVMLSVALTFFSQMAHATVLTQAPTNNGCAILITIPKYNAGDSIVISVAPNPLIFASTPTTWGDWSWNGLVYPPNGPYWYNSLTLNCNGTGVNGEYFFISGADDPGGPVQTVTSATYHSVNGSVSNIPINTVSNITDIPLPPGVTIISVSASSDALNSSQPRYYISVPPQVSNYPVTSLSDSTNTGTLRWAISSANGNANAVSTITFATNGIITLGSPLPFIFKPVTIDGTSAPGYSSNPVVSVNFSGNSGLSISPTAKGSLISGLSLVGASGAALTLQASGVQVSGNFIGLATNGTVAANHGDGILLTSMASNALIGGKEVASSIDYFIADTNSSVFSTNFNAWQGLRGDAASTNFLFAGTANSNGVFYIGPITCNTGTPGYMSYPLTNQNNTSAYGPDNASFTYDSTNGQLVYLTNGAYRVVGSYVLKPDANFYDHGFVWDGTLSQLQVSPTNGTYRTIDYCTTNSRGQTNFRATYQYTHSTMGNLAVGNCDSAGTTNFPPRGLGIAYICKLSNHVGNLTNASDFVTIPTAPLGAKSITAYGIWDNGLVLSTNGTVLSHPYTICGGYSPLAVDNITNPKFPLTQGKGYLVDYDSVSGKFSNWTIITHPGGANIITHLEGISSTESGVYNLAAGSVILGSSGLETPSWVSVNRNDDGTFSQGTWVDLNYPGASNNVLNDNDAVYGNNAVLETISQTNGSTNYSSFGYQALITIDFQRANVISGNQGNGINLLGSVGNVISQNYIGTDANGGTNAAYGNARNGIQLASGSSYNMIGGQFIGSNNPTGSAGSTSPAFQRPPLGNVISGNHLNGVLIENGAQSNILSGNYIGTDGSGTNALGNWFDGVDIEGANGNALLGCAYYQNPFVYYNVISGNYGHGVRINNATNTFFQGNYDGIDALDTTNVSNGGDGLWVSGSSKFVQIGGIIPLGSVISGNRGNGTEISDTVSYATNFNTFGGVPSFKTYPIPNGGDGILITSIGGHNTVRTCVMSGNLGNGVEIGGNATGVLIEDTTSGTSTGISNAIPNQCNGIVLSGSAHGNTIGGFNPSIETSVHASGNVGYGIAVLDSANNNTIVNTRIGVGLALTENRGVLPPIPNQQGGVFLEQGTFATTIGGTKALQANFINNNDGDGVTIIASKSNNIVGNTISSNSAGIYAEGICTGTLIKTNQVSNNSTNWETNTALGIIYH